jgi:hypothetical protein
MAESPNAGATLAPHGWQLRITGGGTGPPSTSMTRVSEQPNRWSKATVYPDMWVDPVDDPRNSDGLSPDGEPATLQDYLSDYRLTPRWQSIRIWASV